MDCFGGSSSGAASLMFTSPLVSSTSSSCDNEMWRKRDFLGSEDQEWRCAKMARTDSSLMSAAVAKVSLRSNSASLFPETQQQMLSFSSPKQDGLMLCNQGSLPYRHLSSSSSSSSSLPYISSSGVKGAFTPSQWMELEHQAIIYKCIDANIPIPPSLLVSIHKSLNRNWCSGYSSASLRQGAFGWGSFQLGYSGSSDPEPGRCRRTDGKKWRCSRDAVVDQKYCERHLNRGRHRSRKPVEGQSGHGKVTSNITSLPVASSASGRLPNATSPNQQEPKGLRSCAGASTIPFNRNSTNKNVTDYQNHSVLNNMNQGLETAQNFLKQQNLYEESTQRTKPGLISSDSVHNASRKSYLENSNFLSTPRATEKDTQPSSFRHFMDSWSRSQSDRSTISWPDIEEAQLSISIHKPSSDFLLSSSPLREKMSLNSQLKQSGEANSIQMGLAVGDANMDVDTDLCHHKLSNWAPVSWETSVGGPLGEVLNNNNSSKDTSENSNTTLNLLSYVRDSEPQHDSSATDVLQKSGFGSVSCSRRSSPQGGNLCDDLLGSTFSNSASIHSSL